MKIGITDNRGRLGKVLAEYYPYVSLYNASEFDVIIHNGAYTNVDQAEKDVSLVLGKNVLFTRKLRNVTDARIIYLSTDFVFDGVAGPYSELSTPKPLSVYGWSKWLGERVLRLSDTIVRTTVLYGGHKPDFVTWVLDQFKSNKEFSVSTRLITSPTNVYHLAEALSVIAEVTFPRHIVNVAGDTVLSRFAFAQMIGEVFEQNLRLLKYTMQSQFGQAKRPERAGLRVDLAKSLNLPIYKVRSGLEKMKNEN